MTDTWRAGTTADGRLAHSRVTPWLLAVRHADTGSTTTGSGAARARVLPRIDPSDVKAGRICSTVLRNAVGVRVRAESRAAALAVANRLQARPLHDLTTALGRAVAAVVPVTVEPAPELEAGPESENQRARSRSAPGRKKQR